MPVIEAKLGVSTLEEFLARYHQCDEELERLRPDGQFWLLHLDTEGQLQSIETTDVKGYFFPNVREESVAISMPDGDDGKLTQVTIRPEKRIQEMLQKP